MAVSVPPVGERNTAMNRANFASMLVSTAMSDTGDRTQLARAISDSFQYAVTGTTVRALITLRSSNPGQADLLFDRAVSIASQNAGNDDVSPFVMALWPARGQEPLPDTWRQFSLELLARALAKPAENAEERTKRCDLYSRVSSRLNDVPADLAQAADTAKQSCQPYAPTPEQAADNELFRHRAPKNADDFLALAAELKLADNRAQMKMNAAMRAENDDKDQERALSIYDGMTPEERAARNGGYYFRQRMDLAVRAALHAIEDDRPEQGVRIIDTSPPDTEAHIAIEVAEKERKKPLPPDVMKIALREIRLHPPADPLDFVGLINLNLKGDAVRDALPDILREMDHWKEKDWKALKVGEMFYLTPWDTLAPLPFAPPLADLDPDFIAGQFATMHPPLRTDLQLILARMWLGRYQAELAKAKEATAAPKQ
jgi:hypothetical protein